MDLTWSPAEDDFRAECRSWLEANVPRGLPSGDTRDGFALHLEWEKLLFENRWAVVSWPGEYGGRDASLWEWLIFEEEYYRAGGPQRVTQNGIFLLAPTVFEFGTPVQRERILPAMAAADELWCQGWSEPGAGSDLAGITSRATKVEDGWRLTGQKTWTTRGAFCTHLFGLFRSDPDSERHKGLTYFLVPLDTPGVTVRGFGRLDGDEGFAEVFFEDALIPDDAVLGEIDQGWSVAMATTGSERGLTLRSPGRFLAAVSRLIELYRERPSAAMRDRVIDAWMKAEAYQLFTLGTVTALAARGGAMGAESSLTKLWWSELDVELHEAALDLLGPEAELDDQWSKGWQFALAGPIYAGTNEIQRNIAAERILGLPRQMRFALTDDQVAFRDAVRDLLAKEPATERATWDALVDMGVTALLVPEADGGLGLDELTLVAVLEETGAAALAFPIVETAMVAAPLGITGGMVASNLGTPGLVPWGTIADVVLTGLDGRLVLTERVAVELVPVAAVDPGRPMARITGEYVGAAAGGQHELERALALGALGTAAQLVGLGRTMLDMTVAHVKDRRQFGVPIGSFQAVKHHLANALLRLEFARPAVHRAAWSIAAGAPTAGRDISMAKAMASDAAAFAGRQALQCHGAIGYTVEYDLHLYLKRTWALSRAWGDAAWHRNRVGTEIGVN